jgi:hypothetical protein
MAWRRGRGGGTGLRLRVVQYEFRVRRGGCLGQECRRCDRLHKSLATRE